MKKILLGVCALAATSFVSANDDCADVTSFTGAYAGMGVVVGFDGNKICVDTATTPKVHKDYSKRKVVAGGELVAGYTYQFTGNFVLGAEVSIAFLSSGKADLSAAATGTAPAASTYNIIAQAKRNCFAPKFTVLLGYACNSEWLIGLRAGVAYGKTTIESKTSATATENNTNHFLSDNKKFNKDVNAVCPLVGVHVEKIVNNRVSVYLNADHIFSKSKDFTVATDFKANTKASYKGESTRLSFGVKYRM